MKINRSQFFVLIAQAILGPRLYAKLGGKKSLQDLINTSYRGRALASLQKCFVLRAPEELDWPVFKTGRTIEWFRYSNASVQGPLTPPPTKAGPMSPAPGYRFGEPPPMYPVSTKSHFPPPTLPDSNVGC